MDREEKPEPNEREAVEERLVALLLGEVPAAEAKELRAKMERDPEAREFYESMRRTSEAVEQALGPDVEEEAAAEPPRLTPGRRRRVEAALGVDTDSGSSAKEGMGAVLRYPRLVVGLSTAAAAMLVLGGVFFFLWRAERIPGHDRFAFGSGSGGEESEAASPRVVEQKQAADRRALETRPEKRAEPEGAAEKGRAETAARADDAKNASEPAPSAPSAERFEAEADGVGAADARRVAPVRNRLSVSGETTWNSRLGADTKRVEVRRSGDGVLVPGGLSEAGEQAVEALLSRLESGSISRFQVDGAPVEEALAGLTAALSDESAGGARLPEDFAVRPSAHVRRRANRDPLTVTVDLRDIRPLAAVDAIARQAGLRYVVYPDKVVLYPPDAIAVSAEEGDG